MRDEAGQARACLASLSATTYEPVEFCIVDDRSADQTSAIAREFAAHDARFRLLSLDEPPAGWSGKARAADAGIRASLGALVIVADADVRHSPQSVACSVRDLEGRELIVALPRAGGRGPAAWCARYLYELLYLVSDERQYFAFGAYAAFTRTLYERLGGWEKAPGHPEVMALAARARHAGARAALVRRDDLYMEQYATVGEASRALLRNTNYQLMPPRPAARVAASLTLCWAGVSFLGQAPLVGSIMLLCYCGLIGYSWRRYGALAALGGFLFALPGALWFTAVSLSSMFWQALGGAVRWRGRSFVR